MFAAAALAAYKSAANVASPALRWHARRRVAKGKETLERLDERFGVATLPRPDGPLIWLHGASVGESTALLPLIDRLRQECPGTAQLLTTTTLTSAELVSAQLPSSAAHQFAPFDTPRWARRFFDHWRPAVGILIESEIWPNLLAEARSRDIRLALVNGRISARSAANWSRVPALARRLFGLFDEVLAQSPADEERLRQLGAKRATYCGNLRFSAPPLAVDQQAVQVEKNRFRGRAIWLAASTHPGEEELIADAHQAIAREQPNLLTIVVPRHPNRAPAIEDLLTSRGLRTGRRSHGGEVGEDTDIYLADTLGELGLWFRLTQIALIGGSLLPFGGHNPLEAARLDCALLCGPHMQNQAVPVAHLRAANAIFVVETATDIADNVRRLLRDDDARTQAISAAARCAAAEAGALDRIFEALRPMLTAALDAPENAA